jgi:hypothetical protein
MISLNNVIISEIDSEIIEYQIKLKIVNISEKKKAKYQSKIGSLEASRTEFETRNNLLEEGVKTFEHFKSQETPYLSFSNTLDENNCGYVEQKDGNYIIHSGNSLTKDALAFHEGIHLGDFLFNNNDGKMKFKEGVLCSPKGDLKYDIKAYSAQFSYLGFKTAEEGIYITTQIPQWIKDKGYDK